jgi:hypothetical protein
MRLQLREPPQPDIPQRLAVDATNVASAPGKFHHNPVHENKNKNSAINDDGTGLFLLLPLAARTRAISEVAVQRMHATAQLFWNSSPVSVLSAEVRGIHG